uniref:XdhC family protein n=1 Tax=Nonomuraea bangladeshensis TaxID=404385 RepID=UPI003F49326E
MRELLEELYEHWRRGETIGVGTVVATYSSAPRSPGAGMLVFADGSVSGSVSGGCVEGAVYELAELVRMGDAPMLQRFGVSDDDAFAVGLTCGGIIDVFIDRMSRHDFPHLESVVESVRNGRPVAVATVIEHRDPHRVGARRVIWPDRATGSLGSVEIDERVTGDARGLLAGGRSATVRYAEDGRRLGEGTSVFVNSFQPPPRMLIFGANDYAQAMVRQAAFLGFRVTVCDARPIFATVSRFPDAHEVVVDWPHRYLAKEIEEGRIDDRTAVAVLTHDPKFDVPVLEVALSAKVAYVGAMGSRRAHEDRLRRLRQAGVTESDVANLASPIGLDLGARTPEETAVSIAAEIITLRWGGGGARLRDGDGAIHGERA